MTMRFFFFYPYVTVVVIVIIDCESLLCLPEKLGACAETQLSNLTLTANVTMKSALSIEQHYEIGNDYWEKLNRQLDTEYGHTKWMAKNHDHFD